MSAPGALLTMCRKTKLCKYFARGCCTRQQDCGFAHSPDELRAYPDLSCTKLCPTLAATGSCDRVGCAYAHGRTEMRKVRLSWGGDQMAKGRQVTQAPGAPAAAAPPDAPTPVKSLTRRGHLAPPGDASSVAISRQTTEEGRSPKSSLSSMGFSKESNPSSSPCSAKVPPPPSPLSRAPLRRAALAAPRPAGDAMRKTVLCAFNLENRCTRGAACHFAHSEEELKAQPDLYRTKLCLRMKIKGSCDDPACRYAHSKEELRAKGQGRKIEAPHAEMAGEEEKEGGSSSAEDARQHATPSWLAGLPEIRFDTGELQVKNTFLTLEDARQHTTPSWLAGLPEIRFDTGELQVKNTFLTLEDSEPPELSTVFRFKSVPALFKFEEEEADGSETEISSPKSSVAEADNTESTASSPKSSVDIDFVHQPLEFPSVYLAPISHVETAEVPVCALQKVDPLQEVVEGLDIVECAFALPASKKVLLKPRAYAAGGK